MVHQIELRDVSFEGLQELRSLGSTELVGVRYELQKQSFFQIFFRVPLKWKVELIFDDNTEK